MDRREAIARVVAEARASAAEWCVGPSEFAAAASELRAALAALGVTEAEMDKAGA